MLFGNKLSGLHPKNILQSKKLHSWCPCPGALTPELAGTLAPACHFLMWCSVACLGRGLEVVQSMRLMVQIWPGQTTENSLFRRKKSLLGFLTWLLVGLEGVMSGPLMGGNKMGAVLPAANGRDRIKNSFISWNSAVAGGVFSLFCQRQREYLSPGS